MQRGERDHDRRAAFFQRVRVTVASHAVAELTRSNVGGTERVGRKAMAPGRARGHRAFARSNVSRTSDVSGRSRARRR
jgi:hypothetical protein